MISRNVNKRVIAQTLKNILSVVFGTVILAAGTAVFLFQFDLVTGGISGLAIVIGELLGGAVSRDLTVAVLTWAAFLAGLAVLGRSFALKTLISTVVYPPALALFSLLLSDGVLGGYFLIGDGAHSDIAYIVASAAGGAMVGLGCALSFVGGGSTGGVDVIALIICKLFPKLKSSRIIFVTDAAVILLGAFVIRDLVITLLGIFSSFVASVIIDKLFPGGQRAFIANIISEHHEKISDLIIKRLDRTTSAISITGGYSGEEKKMLMVTFSAREYTELLSIVSISDPCAFITIHSAHKIGGEGWSSQPQH